MVWFGPSGWRSLRLARSKLIDEAKEQPKVQGTSGVKATEAARSVPALRRAYYERIQQAHERGEFVAWTMWGAPEEILYAMDVLPVLVENYGPVCAAKQIGPYFCQVAESEGYSIDICSYLRTGLGLAQRMHELGAVPDANLNVHIPISQLGKLSSGDLSDMMQAYMAGDVKVEGDLTKAMALRGVIEYLTDKFGFGA